MGGFTQVLCGFGVIRAVTSLFSPILIGFLPPRLQAGGEALRAVRVQRRGRGRLRRLRAAGRAHLGRLLHQLPRLQGIQQIYVSGRAVEHLEWQERGGRNTVGLLMAHIAACPCSR